MSIQSISYKVYQGVITIIGLSIMLISFAASAQEQKVCSTLFGSFDGATIDQNKWFVEDSNGVSQKNGYIDLEITGDASAGQLRKSVFVDRDLSFKAASSVCFEATAALMPSSILPIDSRGRSRIAGTFYNSKFSSNYQKYEGEVWGQLVIEKRFGQMRAFAYAEIPGDPDWTTENAVELFFHVFDTVPTLGVAYNLSIALDKSKKQLVFRFGDEEYVHPIQTPIFQANPDRVFKGIQSVLQAGSGKTVARFFDASYTPNRPNMVPINSLLLQ